jgi:hypothetical protein
MLLHKLRRAYRLMVLGWIVLLGIVPVVLFYRVSRTVERLGEVRRAQMTMLHELAEQPVALPNMMQAFYKTKLLTGEELGSIRTGATSKGSATMSARPPSPATDTWRLNMAVLSRLHPNAEYLDADTLAASSLLLEPTASWRVNSLSGWESDKSVTSFAASRDSQSTVDFWSSPTHGRWQVMVVLLLILALWFVLKYTMHKFFPEVSGPPTRLTWAQKKEQARKEQEGSAAQPPLAANLLPHATGCYQAAATGTMPRRGWWSSLASMPQQCQPPASIAACCFRYLPHSMA